MPTEHILSLLITERDKLNRAIEVLGAPVKPRGRPPKVAQAQASAMLAPVPRKRRLSAAGRTAIVAAAKKRWALIKAGKTAKAAVSGPARAKRQPMTAAQNKALSVKMKVAWAKRKARG